MSLVNTTDATEEDLEVLREQLGRVPRGVVGIAARCLCGRPTVVATAPRLPDGTPFPTTYYLTHPAAVKGASTLEAEHVMDALNEELAADEELRARPPGLHRCAPVPGRRPRDFRRERGRHADARQVPARPRGPLAGRGTGREPDRRSRARHA